MIVPMQRTYRAAAIGVTGGGNYGMGGGTETQMPTMDLNVIQGLMRLFGRG